MHVTNTNNPLVVGSSVTVASVNNQNINITTPSTWVGVDKVGTITDVKVNSASVVTAGVANIPLSDKNTTAGAIKTSSTVSNVTSYTACPVVNGVPYYKDADRYVNSASFADDSTAKPASPVKMTLTRAGSDTATVIANLPKISTSTAGVAPKGISFTAPQDQTTKFLRSDGEWAVPSYTTNTNSYINAASFSQNTSTNTV